ncbi:hypothetical protein PILCRDRAFT_313802 [Piloderma croceum F 1598]|uniref:NADP-dependent oxidoreductase domain-containing protein n=1 Tax=Piloderma croceum (strain F 1598) TaxID=765440 RepID=A0A0C3B3N8_PILCF|nr:hypothetical protein PILCRDRAFT_747845 [Piloderma croceum F 1598]KIM86717.1 hypothetical protein PILCRDRAFT_313802 [Piloderma croceum F 1598]
MPLSKISTITLNTGDEMPILGLGTWKSRPGAVEHAVEFSLKNGYKHIDTAAAYGNETEVGQGIKASGVKREDIFLTTKLDNPDHTRPEEALQDSLNKLNTPYLDLWLMHWPAPMTKDGKSADKSHNWIDTWRSMEELYRDNPDKVKAIGVSNVSVEYMAKLLSDDRKPGVDKDGKVVPKVVPAVNQIELHPSCVQQEILDYCANRSIVLTAYSPLGSDKSPLLKNPIVLQLAEKHKVQPANILISLQANRPFVTVLTKSVTPERIISNRKLIDLTDAEIAELHKIYETDKFRACRPTWTGWGTLGFPDVVTEP